jgi:hypothetical protein
MPTKRNNRLQSLNKERKMNNCGGRGNPAQTSVTCKRQYRKVHTRELHNMLKSLPYNARHYAFDAARSAPRVLLQRHPAHAVSIIVNIVCHQRYVPRNSANLLLLLYAKPLRTLLLQRHARHMACLWHTSQQSWPMQHELAAARVHRRHANASAPCTTPEMGNILWYGREQRRVIMQPQDTTVMICPTPEHSKTPVKPQK